MKIVVGVDGSGFSRAAVEMACRLSSDRTDVEIVVVTAFGLPGPAAAEPFVSMPIYTKETIDGLAATSASVATEAAALIAGKCPNLPVRTKVEMGRAARVILEMAEAVRADLIVVGSHGHGFWGRALLGSVSNSVVHNAQCPVLVVRPKEDTNR